MRATPERVRVERQPNSGPAVARNRGARLASGQAILFIDDDILVPKGFVREHLETLRSHPGCWVIGRIRHPPELRSTPFGRYRDSLWDAFYESHNASSPTETWGMTAANLGLWAADFARLGGFDEAFEIASGEDWDLGERARRAGIRILFHPGIVVLHNDWAVDLERFCERQRLYSISDVLLWRKYGASGLRGPLVQRNAPIDWSQDSFSLAVTKATKALLTAAPGRSFVRALCSVAESLAPDSGLSHRLYGLAVGLAVFQGVREGLKRYAS